MAYIKNTSNVNDSIATKDALELVQDNMREYSLYIAEGRSYNCLLDGAKSAYKRAIYGMHENNSHKIVKVAELASFALPYHPHPSSISGVIVALGDNGNKLKLMETQGNWGDSSKGIKPSADRYIGGYLSDIAEKLFCDSIEYCRFIKGEIDKDEPEALPALLPLCFINGSQGIPSGLPACNIPSLDIIGLIDYYIEILSAGRLDITPKNLPKPNLEIDVVSSIDEWNSILKEGKGTLKVAPVMRIDKSGVITISALPESRDFESVRKIVEKELLLDKIDIRDESTCDTCIVIEKVPHKQCNMNELYARLYKKLQVNLNYNLCFYNDNKIYISCSFDDVVKANLNYVIETQRNRIISEKTKLNEKLEILNVISLLKSNNDLPDLFELSYDDAIKLITNKYDLNKDIVAKALQKPLSYLTKNHDDEILKVTCDIDTLDSNFNDIYGFLKQKYMDIKKELKSLLKNKFKPTKFIKVRNKNA